MTPERGFSQNNVSSSNDIEGRVPKLRFPGFDGPWEQRKLEYIAKYRNGKAHEGCIEDNGKYIVVNSKFVSSNGEVKKYSNLQNEALFKNEIAFVLSDVPNGRAIARTFLIKEDDKYTLNQRIAGITPSNETYPYYLYILMNRHPYFLAFDDGVKQTNLSISDVMGFEAYYPKFEEQRKIGKYFEHLDNIITFHQHKLDALNKYKRGLLQKMFPRNGAKVPEIRFPGFTGDWEQRKLGELCKKFTDGNWIEAKDQSSSGIRLIQTGNVGLGEYIDKPNNKKWISEETFERLNCEEVFAGDILISRLPEPAGRACIVPNLGTKMITAVDCTIVRTVNQINSKFLLQYFSLQSYFDKVNTCLAGGTRQRISRSNLDSFDIMVPRKYEEQEAIGNSLYNLDHLITLYQHKLELLAHYKKGLLQQMFL